MLRTKNGLPKYCAWNTDRHCKRRVRFRKGGFSTYLAGTPWSEEFMRHYAAALDGVKAQASSIGDGRAIAGSVHTVVADYLDTSPGSTSPFKTLAIETQRTRRNILDNFRKRYGTLPLYRVESSGRRTMLLTREHVQRIVNEKSSTPFAQRNFLNTLHAVFKWAMAEGRVPDNPTLGVERLKVSTTGYRTWSEAEIERFEAHHPIGSTPRLAFALMLFAGLRRGDAVRAGPGNVHNGVLTIEQGKTEGQDEAHIEIPVHPKLAAIIAGTTTVGVKTFLVTSFGKPFTAAGFGNRMREWCDAADCPDVSSHGLRKACARRLAEIGCSQHQIAAVTGHASLAMVQHYTKAASRKRMASEAMAKLIEAGS